MYNYQCSITDHPFGNECDKHWNVYNMNTKDWTNDQSITLECKDKGKKERIISSILIELCNLRNKLKFQFLFIVHKQLLQYYQSPTLPSWQHLGMQLHTQQR